MTVSILLPVLFFILTSSRSGDWRNTKRGILRAQVHYFLLSPFSIFTHDCIHHLVFVPCFSFSSFFLVLGYVSWKQMGCQVSLEFEARRTHSNLG